MAHYFAPSQASDQMEVSQLSGVSKNPILALEDCLSFVIDLTYQKSFEPRSEHGPPIDHFPPTN